MNSRGRKTIDRASSCLHLLFSHKADCIRDCLAQFRAGDSLVLLNTAVLLLLDPAWIRDLPAGSTVHAINADVQVHGLAEIQEKTDSMLVDDAGWVRLVKTYAHSLSWK